MTTPSLIFPPLPPPFAATCCVTTQRQAGYQLTQERVPLAVGGGLKLGFEPDVRQQCVYKSSAKLVGLFVITSLVFY